MIDRAVSGGAADECLVDRFLGGDQAAFDRLVVRYRDAVYRFAHWSADADAAEDLAQETFLAVFRGAADWQRRASFRVWLFGIARNVCRHHRRRLAQRGRVFAPDAAPETVADPRRGPLDDLDAGVRDTALAKAITSLPFEQRMALGLRFRAGLAYDEIAMVTGVPIGTVRSRLHSAKRSLAKAMEGGR